MCKFTKSHHTSLKIALRLEGTATRLEAIALRFLLPSAVWRLYRPGSLRSKARQSPSPSCAKIVEVDNKRHQTIRKTDSTSIQHTQGLESG